MQIRSKTSFFLLSLIIIATIASAFMFSDFKLSTSNTGINSQESTCSTGDAVIDLSEGVCLYIDGNDRLSEAISNEIEEKLRQEGKGVFRVKELENRYDYPALLVSVSSEKVSYIPFFPSARVNVVYLYSSTGETKYFNKYKDGETPVVRFFGYSNGEVLKEGELEINDFTKGIISLKAYQNHLAENVASNIIESLVQT